jgi:endogenous inhibitor of DNA gyrase (YacG/DUF329 family)
MSKSSIVTCDKCGKQVKTSYYTDAPGFRAIEIKWNQYRSKKIDLCPECQKKLGIEEEIKNPNYTSEESTADRLYDIIAEIIAENKEEK